MRKIAKYLKQYIGENFSPALYISTAIFLIICISINYHYDFEDSILDSYQGTILGTVFFFVFQAFPYYFVCFLVYVLGRKRDLFSKRGFWLTSIVGFLVLAVDRSLSSYTLIGSIAPPELKVFIYKCINNISTLIIIAVPLFILYKLDKRQDSFYGVTFKDLDLKPYFVLLVMVVPLIIGASFSADFLKQYPMYQRVSGQLASEYWNVSEIFVTGMFEISYALSFFSIELFFRGFLIFGLLRFIGPHAVLPMVATYAFLHFGKPLGETIGSIFGGYILGVIALYSRNIWGGVIVHVGLALLMELVAWIQH